MFEKLNINDKNHKTIKDNIKNKIIFKNSLKFKKFKCENLGSFN